MCFTEINGEVINLCGKCYKKETGKELKKKRSHSPFDPNFLVINPSVAERLRSSWHEDIPEISLGSIPRQPMAPLVIMSPRNHGLMAFRESMEKYSNNIQLIAYSSGSKSLRGHGSNILFDDVAYP